MPDSPRINTRDEFKHRRVTPAGQVALNRRAELFSNLLDELEIMIGRSSAGWAPMVAHLEIAAMLAARELATRHEDFEVPTPDPPPQSTRITPGLRFA